MDKSVNPFTSVHVVPAYGPRECDVSWKLKPEYSAWGVLVYRRVSDGADWVLLNTNDDLVFTGSLTDYELPVGSMLNRVMYRVSAENTVTHDVLDGPIVGLFETIAQPYHTDARRMASAEVQRLRMGAGLPAWIMPDVRVGTLAPGMSAASGLLKDDCANRQAGGQAVNMTSAGVWQTWVQLLTIQQTKVQRPDGTSTAEAVDIPARLPCYPQPNTGTMIVLPGTDDRYVVGEKVTPLLYRGVVPIAYEVGLKLLARNDARYNLTMPTLDPRLTRPMFKPAA